MAKYTPLFCDETEPMLSNFTCTICHGYFTSPSQLPCGHVFCGSCIERWLRNNSGCPVCRHDCDDDEMRPAIFVKN
eukprot:1907972-Rhodomonas_salina.1